MKKFHTLPGVIPRVGVAEGQGAFARWSFTVSAALLLLLSAEGARGAGVDGCRDLLPSEFAIARQAPHMTPAGRQELGLVDFRCCGPKAKIPAGYQRVSTGCTASSTLGRDPNFNANQIIFKVPTTNNSASTNQKQNDNDNSSHPRGGPNADATPPAPQQSKAPQNNGSNYVPNYEIDTLNTQIGILSTKLKTAEDQLAFEKFYAPTDSERHAPLVQSTIALKTQISELEAKRNEIVNSSGGTGTAGTGTAGTGTAGTGTAGTGTAGTGTAGGPTTTPPPGPTGGGQSTTTYKSEIGKWKSDFNRKREDKQKASNADPCYVSGELSADYKCAGTTRALENAKNITGGAVVAGTVSMAMKNQTAVNQALQSGSQSGNLDAQASIQAGQESINKTIGLLQVTQAVMLQNKANSHGKTIRQLEGNLVNREAVQLDDNRVNRTDQDNQDATAALQKFVNEESVSGVDLIGGTGSTQDLEVGRLTKQEVRIGPNLLETTGKAVAKDLNTAVKTVGQAAVVEQREQQKKASAAALEIASQAVAALGAAEIARQNKVMLQMSAQAVKQVEKSTKDLTFQFAPNDRSPNQLAAPNQSLSLSSAQDASQSKTDGLGQNGTDDPTGETPNFGSPFGAPNDPIPQPSPQPVGEFQRNPNGGGGGGGGGAGGGTSTQPSSNDDDHGGGGGSTYYKLANNKDQYSAGGGGVGGSGGGGGNAGMDFTGMLSQFLPKAEDQGPKNGILDFGARAPAQTALPSSLLDASANLFERVHEAYQSKNRKGQVGQAVSGGKNP